jgi:hypothetical protein
MEHSRVLDRGTFPVRQAEEREEQQQQQQEEEEEQEQEEVEELLLPEVGWQWWVMMASRYRARSVFRPRQAPMLEM